MNNFDQVRSEPYNGTRTSRSSALAADMSHLLQTWGDIVDIDTSQRPGERLYHVISRIRALELRYDPKFIMDLLAVYCTWDSAFLCNIARSALTKLFTIPSPVPFTGKDIFIFRQYLHVNYPTNSTQEERERHLMLSEMIAKFFFAYAESAWRHTPHVSEMCGVMFQSSLIGLAQGDALGFLVEGQYHHVAKEYVDKVVRTKKYKDFGVHKDFGQKGGSRYTSIRSEAAFWFGQYTDDTQLCRELIRSISSCGGNFVPSDFAKRLVILFRKSGLLRADSASLGEVDNISTGIVGYGGATLKSTQCLADGMSWEQTGTLIKSQGNGGCMRVAPLGALFFEQPWKLKEIASAQALGTHGSSRCRATCVLVAEAARLACESKIYPWSVHLPHEPKMFCARLADVVRSVDVEVAKAIAHVPEWLKIYDTTKMVQAITAKGAELGDSLWGNGTIISSSAVQTALFALCCFLTHPNSYLDTVCMAISAGGDTDTTAAIAGAIVACRTMKTIDAFVSDQGEWRVTDLATLSLEARKSVSPL